MNLMLARSDLLEEADRSSREAFVRFPKIPSFAGTRGFTLIRLGRVEEGMRLAERAFHEHADDGSRALVACCLAIGAAKLDRGSAAQEYLEKARNLDSTCIFLPLAADEVRSGVRAPA